MHQPLIPQAPAHAPRLPVIATALSLCALAAIPPTPAIAQPPAEAVTCSILDRYLRAVLNQRIGMGDVLVDLDMAVTDELDDTLSACRYKDFRQALERDAALAGMLEGPAEAVSSKEIAKR